MSSDFMLEQLGMSVNDADRIKEMCEDKGITAKQVIRQFLCDLTGNDHSGGSDERMLIDDWFCRSQF